MRRKYGHALIIMITFLIFIYTYGVHAQSKDYYTNENGVKVSTKTYNFINEFYGNNYFEKMTIDDLNWIQDLNIDNSDVEIKTIYDYGISPMTSSLNQNGKTLTIVKSCSKNCAIIVKCTWTSLPNVRSYDIIGARFSGTNLISDSIVTKFSSSEGYDFVYDVKRFVNGFGTSVKLPSGSNVTIEQKYTLAKGGKVYASYQHAKKQISLSNSQLFVIDSAGYGNVFKFYGAATGVYDEMEGVDISL